MQTKTEKIITKILFYITLIYAICVIISALSGCNKNQIQPQIKTKNSYIYKID
jgi:hypothetical protein